MSNIICFSFCFVYFLSGHRFGTCGDQSTAPNPFCDANTTYPHSWEFWRIHGRQRKGILALLLTSRVSNGNTSFVAKKKAREFWVDFYREITVVAIRFFFCSLLHTLMFFLAFACFYFNLLCKFRSVHFPLSFPHSDLLQCNFYGCS